MELNSESDRLEKWKPVEAELNRSKIVHPNYPNDMFEQLAIMQEEAGEVAKAVLHLHHENGSIEQVRKELIQTAAMCMKMINHLPEQWPNLKK